MISIVFAYVVLSVIAANLPFVIERSLLRFGSAKRMKPWYERMVELLLLYIVVLIVGRLIESRFSAVHGQGWPFFVSTIALFLVGAYPSLVWRYFWRRAG